MDLNIDNVEVLEAPDGEMGPKHDDDFAIEKEGE